MGRLWERLARRARRSEATSSRTRRARPAARKAPSDGTGFARGGCWTPGTASGQEPHRQRVWIPAFVGMTIGAAVGRVAAAVIPPKVYKVYTCGAFRRGCWCLDPSPLTVAPAKAGASCGSCCALSTGDPSLRWDGVDGVGQRRSFGSRGGAEARRGCAWGHAACCNMVEGLLAQPGVGRCMPSTLPRRLPCRTAPIAVARSSRGGRGRA